MSYYGLDEYIQKNDPAAWAVIQKAKNDWAIAAAAGDEDGMKKANEKAEEERAKYGYSGGADGITYSAADPAENITGVTVLPDGTAVSPASPVSRIVTPAPGDAAYSDTQALWGDSENYYARAYSAKKSVIDGAVASRVNEIENQREGVHQGYDDLQKQAYALYMGQKKDLPTQLAMLGLENTGVSETVAAAIINAYQNNYSLTERDRLQAMSELDAAISSARAAGEQQTAELMSSYYNTLANLRIAREQETYTRTQAEEQAAEAKKQQEWAEARAKEQDAYTRERYEWEKQQYDEDQKIQENTNRLIAGLPTQAQEDAANAALKSGDFSPWVIKTLEACGYTNDYFASYGYPPKRSEQEILLDYKNGKYASDDDFIRDLEENGHDATPYLVEPGLLTLKNTPEELSSFIERLVLSNENETAAAHLKFWRDTKMINDATYNSLLAHYDLKEYTGEHPSPKYSSSFGRYSYGTADTERQDELKGMPTSLIDYISRLAVMYDAKTAKSHLQKWLEVGIIDQGQYIAALDYFGLPKNRGEDYLSNKNG